ncbi:MULTISPECIES: hypothetical protein [Rhodopseudomonas]|uniref:hypothetical protein n=1 Tax=Rhodopseudomonas TaxID=1073 RepID=UPI0006968D40|nr:MULTISPECIES: hypothetical protein [Rhodopseudomonas]MDF3812877.1 hypothetical protein [Rhodopseudomonas sp. BAL398]WOK17515.1 hypothetical protein RBJ75_25915 [Rhodopseudomonas sp. BAL398]
MNDESSAGQKATHFVHDLGDAMRRNPVSTALIGAGLLWLFTGGKTVDRATRLAHDAGLDRLPDRAADALSKGRSAVKQGVDALGERLSEVSGEASAMADSATRVVRERGAEAIDRASRYGSEFAESAAHLGRSIPDKSAGLASDARSRLTELFDEQPLLLGAVGVAIGAGIAASLPATKIEAEVFAAAGDQIKTGASGLAMQQVARAAVHVAEEARRDDEARPG